jgi:hypothetical protein
MCLLLSSGLSKVALAGYIERAEARPQITRSSVEHVHRAESEQRGHGALGIFGRLHVFVVAALLADHGSQNENAFFPAFDEAAKRVPRANSRNVGCVWLLRSTHTLPMF